MVESVRSHRGTGPLTQPRRSADGDSGSDAAEGRGASQASRTERDRNEAAGASRLGSKGEYGEMPWGGEGGAVDSAYSNSCVSSMFVKEWQAQRPAEFKAAAQALRETGEFTVNGQTIKLDDQRKSTLASKGLLESDEAVVDAALLGTARANTGKNAEGGMDEDGAKFLEDTLQLGVNLAEGDAAQVGDYVAVGTGANKHFMKVMGEGEGGFKLQDAQGNQVTMSKAELKSASDLDDGDNLGGWSSCGVSASTSGKRPPRK